MRAQLLGRGQDLPRDDRARRARRTRSSSRASPRSRSSTRPTARSSRRTGRSSARRCIGQHVHGRRSGSNRRAVGRGATTTPSASGRHRTSARRTPTSSDGQAARRRRTARQRARRRRAGAGRRRDGVGLGTRSPHLEAQRAVCRPGGSPRRVAISTQKLQRAHRRQHRRRVARVPRRAGRQRAGAEPRAATHARRLSGLGSRRWRAANSASTWAPPRRRARRSPCSTRAGGAHERGTDVVVGFVETHGRPRTAEQIGDLEVVPAPVIELPRRRRSRRWTSTRCSRRKPDVALVDELAHTNVPGSRQREAVAGRRGAARRRDRRDLDGEHPAPRVGERRRRADHRRQATRDHPRRRRAARRPDRARRHDAGGAAPPHGARQHLPAETHRRRARRTTSGPATSPRCASSRCCGSPTASTRRSRTTASATASPSRGRRASECSSRSPARPSTEALIRRAARMAQRAARRAARRPRAQRRRTRRAARPTLETHRQLLEDLGGEYHEVVGVERRAGARRLRARPRTAPSSSRCEPPVALAGAAARGSVINRVIRLSGPIDVHVISHEPRAEARSCARRARRPARRRALPAAAARGVGRWRVVGLPLLTFGALAARATSRRPAERAAALPARRRGGRGDRRALPAIGTAVVGVPARQLVLHAADPHAGRSTKRENLLALIVFLVVAGVVSALVARPRRRRSPRRRGPRRSRDAGAPRPRRVTSDDPLRRPRRAPAVVVRARRASRSLHRRRATVGRGGRRGLDRHRSARGRPTSSTAARPTTSCSRSSAAGSRPTTAACSTPSRRSSRPRSSGAASPKRPRRGRAGQANELRTALLQAVSHDLRTPLAVDQGVGVEPASARRRRGPTTTPAEFLADDRGRDRPAHRARRRTCST